MVAPTSTTEVAYGVPPNYFVGARHSSATEPVQPTASASQTGAVAAGAVRPVQQTGQTGAMGLASATPPPLASI